MRVRQVGCGLNVDHRQILTLDMRKNPSERKHYILENPVLPAEE